MNGWGERCKTWLQTGIENGFCTEPFCEQHDGMQMTSVEVEKFETGIDPCIFAVRIFETAEDSALWREDTGQSNNGGQPQTVLRLLPND